MFFKLITKKKYQGFLNSIQRLNESLEESHDKITNLHDENVQLRDLSLKFNKSATKLDKLNSFMFDKINSLFTHDVEELYNEVSNLLDEDKYIELQIVKELTKIDLYSFYSYEDNMGFFAGIEDLNTFVRLYEEAAFGSFKYEIIEGTLSALFERAILLNDNKETSQYLIYRQNVERELIKQLFLEKPDKLIPYLLK